jgi:hypothetical protein
MSNYVAPWAFAPQAEKAYNNEVAKGVDAVQADYLTTLCFAGHKVEHLIGLSWLTTSVGPGDIMAIPLLISPYTEFLRVWFRVFVATEGDNMWVTSSADVANPSNFIISGGAPSEYQSNVRQSDAPGALLPQDLRVNVTDTETLILVTIQTFFIATKIDAIVFEEISYSDQNKSLI